LIKVFTVIHKELIWYEMSLWIAMTCWMLLKTVFVIQCWSTVQVKPVTRNKLQLVGVTAMLLASKYEEMFAPEVADFVYITDNAYAKADIWEMERDILRTLDFCLGKPLCLHFLRRNSKAGEVSETFCFQPHGWFGLVVALCPQTPKHIRGGWSHTDTCEPVDGVGTLQL
jgi:hypothetical protein